MRGNDIRIGTEEHDQIEPIVRFDLGDERLKLANDVGIDQVAAGGNSRIGGSSVESDLLVTLCPWGAPSFRHAVPTEVPVSARRANRKTAPSGVLGTAHSVLRGPRQSSGKSTAPFPCHRFSL